MTYPSSYIHNMSYLLKRSFSERGEEETRSQGGNHYQNDLLLMGITSSGYYSSRVSAAQIINAKETLISPSTVEDCAEIAVS